LGDISGERGGRAFYQKGTSIWDGDKVKKYLRRGLDAVCKKGVVAKGLNGSPEQSGEGGERRNDYRKIVVGVWSRMRFYCHKPRILTEKKEAISEKGTGGKQNGVQGKRFVQWRGDATHSTSRKEEGHVEDGRKGGTHKERGISRIRERQAGKWDHRGARKGFWYQATAELQAGEQETGKS